MQGEVVELRNMTQPPMVTPTSPLVVINNQVDGNILEQSEESRAPKAGRTHRRAHPDAYSVITNHY